MAGPQLTSQTWVYSWDAPRGGWPTIVIPNPARKPPPRVQVTRISVTVQSQDGGAPEVVGVSYRGKWAGSAKPLTGVRTLALRRPDPLGRVQAPDWVRDLAAEAVQLAEKENR